jgi:cell division protein FtsN
MLVALNMNQSMLLIAATVLIVFIMALVNTINVTAQSQNETNETDIGENQSVSGRISGLGQDLLFGR